MEFQFVSRGDVHKRVARVCRIGVRIEAEIHLLAVSILKHTCEHGDYTAGESLLNGLPRGQRVKALAFWFKHYSNSKLTFKPGEGGMYIGKLDKQRDNADFDVEGAIAQSFADLTNETAPQTVTVEKLLKTLKSRANNSELNDDGSPKVDPRARDVASRILQFVKENRLDVAA